MTRAVAYCAFLARPDIILPAAGVEGAAIQQIEQERLRVLWSEVDWPFQPAAMQRNAVDFHHVIGQVFAQAAVAPFPLLTVFDNRLSLATYLAGRARYFASDLERLRELVQMECVLYVVGQRPEAEVGQSARDLKKRTELLLMVRRLAGQVQEALREISPEVRIREVKSGCRLFALVKRGEEPKFHAIAKNFSMPEAISRRTSGPRPASEFLSDAAKAR